MCLLPTPMLLLDVSFSLVGPQFREPAGATVSLSGRRATIVGSMEALLHPAVARALEKCVEAVAAGPSAWDETRTAKAIVGHTEALGTVPSTLSWSLLTRPKSSDRSHQLQLHLEIDGCALKSTGPNDALVVAARRLRRKLDEAADAKTDGVSAFATKDYRAAAAAFRGSLKAIEAGLLPLVPFPEDDVARVCRALTAAAHALAATNLSNVAQCILLLPEADVSPSEVHQGIRYCDRGMKLLLSQTAADILPSSVASSSSSASSSASTLQLAALRVKLLFRKAKLQRRLCDFTAAIGTLRQLEGMALDAQSLGDIRRELAAVIKC